MSAKATIWRWWGKAHVPLVVYRKLLAAKRAGIVNPLITYRACRRVGLDYAIGCSVLFEETGGGHNEWGHDPTIFIGGFDALHGVRHGEIVTKAAYLEYKRQRGTTRMQGVGPMQLTWYSKQDRADALGGCWKSRHNIQVGLSDVATAIRTYGLHAGIARYNGAGPAAYNYATQVLARAERLRAQGV